MNKILEAKFPYIYKTISELPNAREAFDALRSACAVMDELVRAINTQSSSYQKGSREAAIAVGLLKSVSDSALELRNRFNISRMLLASNDPYRVSAIIESLATQLEMEGRAPQGGFTPPDAPAEPIGAAFSCKPEDEQEQENEKPVEELIN